NVFEQRVLAIRPRQFGFDPFQGGMKTVGPFAELSRCGRDRVAPAELKVRNRFIEVTTQSILRVWLEGALAILGDQFLDFAGAEVPARRLSTRTSGFRDCAAFRSHDRPIISLLPRLERIGEPLAGCALLRARSGCCSGIISCRCVNSID